MYYTNIFNDGFVEDFLDELFGGATGRSCGEENKKSQPPKRVANLRTDISEDDKGYKFEVDLPGFDKSEVSIELKNDYLTIRAEHAEKEENKEAEETKYLRKERYKGLRQRSYYVGENIKAEGIKASFNNGVLTIDVPKPEPKEEAKVTINID
ncbi:MULTISPECIES: Hsp20/alpha crystallin family protein [Eubacterium]|uniref:Molecular chaperone IbpA, HSP20 family n=1 Tax=Eubacterium ruminantium TaxID=42322 RepID=A0A1T4L103_9FIRM|nr:MULTISPECIES: Hsp20/alpha crystallin family protein [Eubacterium]MCR5368115.1 Hsp20/alpha crystallin family protein [Eubacterium sp.]SCW42561.1 Molecular chaperone IbpA, HSP20 family [Eubacterium ruminantium]SDN21109.1 heat shock protein Hsp20 [Eubacterium ruminantium]SJZ48412.1 Molecular chaperone IbpA, HSP20 family [Eubacterium ruminantium]